MPEKFNAARRVRNILSTAKRQDENGSTLNAWGSTFQTLDLPNPQFETFRLLQMLMEQMNNLAKEVEGFGLDKSDYQVTFNSLYNILKVTNLDTTWQHYQRNITDEVIRQLGMFAQWSHIDEPVVPVEDIAQLKEDLQRFQHKVLQDDIDERLRAFVLKQIRTILGALREYPIRGEEAIEDGDTTLFATFISEHELIREHKGEEVIEETMSMWERMTNLLPWGNFGINLARMLMDVDVDPQKAIEAGSKAIEAGSDVIDKLRVDTLESYETSQEVADRLGVDSSQIRRYCELERFAGAVKIANRWFIPKGAMPEAKDFGRPQSFARSES